MYDIWDNDFDRKFDEAVDEIEREAEEPEEPVDLEMGFNPYMGCYDNDC